jgi:hypothetical protein
MWALLAPNQRAQVAAYGLSGPRFVLVDLTVNATIANDWGFVTADGQRGGAGAIDQGDTGGVLALKSRG